jgi:hypothetical protein
MWDLAAVAYFEALSLYLPLSTEKRAAQTVCRFSASLVASHLLYFHLQLPRCHWPSQTCDILSLNYLLPNFLVRTPPGCRLSIKKRSKIQSVTCKNSDMFRLYVCSHLQTEYRTLNEIVSYFFSLYTCYLVPSRDSSTNFCLSFRNMQVLLGPTPSPQALRGCTFYIHRIVSAPSRMPCCDDRGHT